MGCKPCQKRAEEAERYNVFNAAADVVRGAVSNKNVFVDADTAQSRLDICLHCPSGDYNDKLHICNVCKCLVKSKVKFPKSSCPMGHWKAVENNTEPVVNVVNTTESGEPK